MHRHEWVFVQSKHDDDWNEDSWAEAAVGAGFDAESPRDCPAHQYRCGRCGTLILSDLDDPTSEVRAEFRDCDSIIVERVMSS
jgi:hypothetical protein